MPKEVAMTFEVVGAEVDFDELETTLEVPVHVERYLALPGRMHHAAGHDKFAQFFMKADKNLIGGKDHVFEARGGSDGLDLASSMFQSGTKSLPLLLSPDAIDRRLPGHIRIFLVDDVEICGRTQEDLLLHVAGMVARSTLGGKERKTKILINAEGSARGRKPASDSGIKCQGIELRRVRQCLAS
jgi:hypothetical protein